VKLRSMLLGFWQNTTNNQKSANNENTERAM
jgi:hypothetical protein